MLWFGTQASQIQNSLEGGVYLLSPTEYAEAAMSSGNLQMKAESLMGSKHYQAALFEQLLMRLLPPALIFLLVLFLLSVLLWQILKHLQNGRTVKIAEQILSSTEDFVFTDEPILQRLMKN